MKRLFFIPLLIFGFISCQMASETPNNEQYDAVITNVFSGDTLEITFDYEKPNGAVKRENVKLIGVKAPAYYLFQPSEYYALESYQNLRRYINSPVLIELDDTDSSRTSEGYLRAYIWINVNGEILNKKLLRNGYVKFDGSTAFNPGRMADFAAAEAYAKEWNKGMWE